MRSGASSSCRTSDVREVWRRPLSPPYQAPWCMRLCAWSTPQGVMVRSVHTQGLRSIEIVSHIRVPSYPSVYCSTVYGDEQVIPLYSPYCGVRLTSALTQEKF